MAGQKAGPLLPAHMAGVGLGGLHQRGMEALLLAALPPRAKLLFHNSLITDFNFSTQHVGKLEYSQHLARAPCQRREDLGSQVSICSVSGK